MYEVMERFCDSLELPPIAIAGDEAKSSPGQRRGGKLTDSHLPTPSELAATEPIFWPPHRLARRANAFGSLSRTHLSPDELDAICRIFRRERFLLVVGPNLKKHRRVDLADGVWFDRNRASSLKRQENCHIVLHKDASNVDIAKSALALTILRRRLASAAAVLPEATRSRDCYPLIEQACRDADRSFATFLRDTAKRGWESPARSMFGRVHMRADWPLS
jgi:hypothetical protein